MTAAAALFALLGLALLGVSDWLANLLLYARRQPLTRTPADYGLPYEEVSCRSQDGLRLHGWWIPAAAADPPVMLILHPRFGNRHGLCVAQQPWPPLFGTDVDLLQCAQACHRAGYTVFMLDLRNHGESQHGLGAGGLTEDQDVMGAVDYVFQRIAPNDPAAAKVGVIGFGLGAAAALAAVGREKGGAEVIRVFSGDSEGGSGFLTIQPPTVKRLRFVVAVQPASLGVLLRGYLRQRMGPMGLILLPLVDWFCRRRGGYPLTATSLLKPVREVHLPVLYVQSHGDLRSVCHEVQGHYAATPGPKEIWWLDPPLGRLEGYQYVCEQMEPILAFADRQLHTC
ncbi:MAG: hypothetical protein R3C14_47510 [Caldilineaceae bacterium]